MTAPDAAGIPDSRSTPQTAGRVLAARWREAAEEIEQGRFADDPANRAEVETLYECARQLEAIAAVDVPDTTPIDEWPDPENPITGRTPGAAAPAGTAAPGVLATAVAALRRIAGTGTLEDAHEMADEALESIAPDACRTCGGTGTLVVPDSNYESASEQACPDCEPQPAPELADVLGELVRVLLQGGQDAASVRREALGVIQREMPEMIDGQSWRALPAPDPDGQQRYIEQLHDLIRDILTGYIVEPSAGSAEYWRRAGQLHVHDSNGRPFGENL